MFSLCCSFCFFFCLVRNSARNRLISCMSQSDACLYCEMQLEWKGLNYCMTNLKLLWSTPLLHILIRCSLHGPRIVASIEFEGNSRNPANFQAARERSRFYYEQFSVRSTRKKQTNKKTQVQKPSENTGFDFPAHMPSLTSLFWSSFTAISELHSGFKYSW